MSRQGLGAINRARIKVCGKKNLMDFIEKWFGVSPDGGDGSLEIVYIIALAVVISVFLFRSRIRNLIRRRRERSREG
jgi:hypothetical protein